VAAGFQEAWSTSDRAGAEACLRTPTWRLAVVGGVACNTRLREKLGRGRRRRGCRSIPAGAFLHDNAAMVAAWDITS